MLLFSHSVMCDSLWPHGLQHASFSISPSNEYSGLISFRIDWFDLFAVQGALKSAPTPQFRNISSLLLSLLNGPILTSIHDYWKTIALTGRTFVGKIVSLLFNVLSSLVIAFLPRSKWLLISLLQSPSAVILEPKKIKPVTVCIVFPSICHKVMGPLQTFISLNIPVPRVKWWLPWWLRR